jgi:hypothetical protein
MLVLTYPKKQSVAFSDTFLKHYESATETSEKEIHFDLSKIESLTPLGVIILTATIYECSRQKKICRLSDPENKLSKSFLQEIGFYDHFGIDKILAANFDAVKQGSIQLRKTRGLDPMLIETLIEILNYHLRISPGVKGFLQMSLIETMTNIIDHSEVEDYFVCCWMYPQKKQIRLCIADMGIGIKASLHKSEKYASVLNDNRAIMLSTEEGVSSRPGRAGLGLSHIKKFLSVNKGQMCIVSGKGRVFWKFGQNKVLKQNMNQVFGGTIIKMVINTEKEWRYFLASEKDYLF